MWGDNHCTVITEILQGSTEEPGELLRAVTSLERDLGGCAAARRPETWTDRHGLGDDMWRFETFMDLALDLS